MTFSTSRGGGINFETKALNCQNGGGTAAIIYNNVPGEIGGGVAVGTQTKIPVIELNQGDGNQMKTAANGQLLTIELKMGYGYLSGTSMAVPHVVGVASKVWRAVSTLVLSFVKCAQLCPPIHLTTLCLLCSSSSAPHAPIAKLNHV
jgi:PA domain